MYQSRRSFYVDGISYRQPKVLYVLALQITYTAVGEAAFMQDWFGCVQQQITNYTEWIDLKSTRMYETTIPRESEPQDRDDSIQQRYNIMRRSPRNPIYHPLYVEYGYNKIELFYRIPLYHRNTMNRLSPQVFISSFFLRILGLIFPIRSFYSSFALQQISNLENVCTNEEDPQSAYYD